MGLLSSIGKLAGKVVGSVTGGDLLGFAGSIGGSLLDQAGARDANSAYAASTREQMAFQERMSSTAHQRQVADLIAAGLNPKLSAAYGGSSTPSGASYQPVNELASAKDAALRAAQVGQIRLSNKLTEAQIVKTLADSRKSNAEADKAEVMKAPFTAVKNAIPQIKSTAKDMADFYSGDSDLSPRGIYKWATGKNSSTAKDVSDYRKSSHPLSMIPKLNIRDLPPLPIEVRPSHKKGKS